MAHFQEKFFSTILRKFIFFELGELFTCENAKFCVDAPQALYPWSKFGPHRLRFRYLFGQKKLFSPLQPGESVRRSYKYYIRQIGQIILTTESVDVGDILLNNIPLPYRKRSNNNQLFVARQNIKAQSIYRPATTTAASRARIFHFRWPAVDHLYLRSVSLYNLRLVPSRPAFSYRPNATHKQVLCCSEISIAVL